MMIVLHALTNQWLYEKFLKCKFWLESIALLGHMVTNNGIMVGPTKIEVVQDWSWPTSVTNIQSFVGLASYY